MRARILPCATLVICWCLYAGWHWGDPFDETEHAHVAWLIGAQGQRPIRDFFQHHQPVLWDVLKTYYVLGGTGPEVLYFGRALVVVCTLLFVLGLALLVRRFTPPEKRSWRMAFAGSAICALPVVALSLFFPGLHGIRPETLSLPLFIFAVWLWIPADALDRPRMWRDRTGELLAGCLMGAAVFTSPRFAYLVFAFLFLLPHPRRVIDFRLGRALLFAAGAVGFVVGYLALTGYTAAEVYFNLAFTGSMVGIGQGNFDRAARMMFAGVILTGFLLSIGHGLKGRPRLRFLAHAAFFFTLVVLGLKTTWPWLYPNNHVACAAWCSVLAAAAIGRLGIPGGIHGRAWSGAVALAAVACLAVLAHDVANDQTIAVRVAQKRSILAALRPGDTVLTATAAHPIAAFDASYYNCPIVDSPDRLRLGVEKNRQRWPLPECDLIGDIRREKPAYLDGWLFMALSPGAAMELDELLSAEYEPIHPGDREGRGLMRTIFRRKSKTLAAAE